ncbi:MAG: histidinol-phosphatase HisJ family protein [Clostridia bacterium]|nr:histidinol-phosphatase HisJ family protein [Clostridia bacterium]
MFDNHSHTQYSGDIPKGRGNSVRELCLSAIEKGLKGIAITDHFDIDGIRDGFFPPLDHDSVAQDIYEARAEFAGKLTVLQGIELGQATHMPEESHSQLASQPYDIVLGSVHAVRGIIDFADTDIKSMSKNEYIRLWEQYIEEMLDTIEWGNFDVLTHITYPKRYYLGNGITEFPDIKNKGREYFEPVLKAVIDKGITLECNTSGLRQAMGECLPNRDLLSFYYELGGRDITIGSDAHKAIDVGANFADAKEMLSDIGFTHLASFCLRKKDFYRISED